MIRRVIVTNHIGESLTFLLPSPEESGLAISNIEGLGPVAAEINTSETALLDGVIFNSARLPSRNIVFHFYMMWAPTIEDSRLITYKYFPVKRRVSLLFETDNRMVEIQGYVESNEPEIFSEMESTAISIVCPNPYFYSSEFTETSFYGVEPLFEFEFENDSLEERRLEFSEISQSTTKNILYEGDADVGMLMTIMATGPVGDLLIYNSGTRETMKILESKMISITGAAFHSGDVISISTIKGNKYITLLREGNLTNILNVLDRDSDWIEITRGNNAIAYDADYGSEYVIFKINYPIAFEGI